MATAESNSIGLLLVGHGSQLPYYKENLEKLVAILRKRSTFGEVAISFMQRDPPTIGEALDMLAQRKMSKIVLVPVFLAAGIHTTHDIPKLIGVQEKELQLRERSMKLFYGEPLGYDERIAEILEEKAYKALGQEIK